MVIYSTGNTAHGKNSKQTFRQMSLQNDLKKNTMCGSESFNSAHVHLQPANWAVNDHASLK